MLVLVAADLIGFADLASLTMVAVGAVGAFLVLAAGAGRRALMPAVGVPGMPSRGVPPSKRAFLIMNPGSGGGKVAKFGTEKAEALGAKVALWESPGVVDVAALARAPGDIPAAARSGCIHG